jgi:hypothetical protein
MLTRVFHGSTEESGASLRGIRSGRPGSAALFVLASALATCAACGPVAAYQRGRLAHPSMQLGEMTTAAEAHVNAVHEGATGGAVGASSGCGCN